MVECTSHGDRAVPTIVLVGPTAIGKTSLSIELAHAFDCEIIGVDSMQIYKYMDIGTAKITPAEMDGIRHHLIDIVFPDQEYDAARFVRDARSAAQEIAQRGRIPLMTGGTGLYLKAYAEGLFDALPANPAIRDGLQIRLTREGSWKLHEELQLCDPVSAQRIHFNDSARIIRGLEIFLVTGTPWSQHLKEQERGASDVQHLLILGLTCQRDRLYERINRRTELMVAAGLEEEVRMLLAQGYGPGLKSMSSIGYRHMLSFIDGSWSREEMVEYLARDTRRYAKRQYTWFNKTRGLRWFDIGDKDRLKTEISSWLRQ